MARILAIAELRMREGIAARLAWLVPLAFGIGAAVALWAEGPDAAARAALADRVVLWTVWGLAFVVAAVIPALGLPADIRTGAAQTLLSSPVTRFEVVFGGTLGYAALSWLLLTAMAGASVLGMQVAGVGAGERDPIRPETPAELGSGSGVAVVESAAPEAVFRFRVPRGLGPGEPLRVRFEPHAQMETGRAQRAGTAVVTVRRPGAAGGPSANIRFKAGTEFTARVPLGDLAAGQDAELSFLRTSGEWRLTFALGSVEIGGARRLYSVGLLVASLCAAPLLFAFAALGSLGAARFGAPTAALFAAFVFLLFVGRGFIVDAAQFMVSAANDPTLGVEHEDHEGHHHTPPDEITPLRLALAKGAIAVFGVLPSYDTFDRTDSLVERRAVDLGDVGRAAGEGLPSVLVLTAAGWLLLRRRELTPG